MGIIKAIFKWGMIIFIAINMFANLGILAIPFLAGAMLFFYGLFKVADDIKEHQNNA